MAMIDNGDFISLDEAKSLTSEFRTQYRDFPKAFLAGKDKLIQILNQEDCDGLRIYNGYNADSKQTNLVIVGVDKFGNDLFNGLIMDKLGMCPPVCDVRSPLQ